MTIRIDEAVRVHEAVVLWLVVARAAAATLGTNPSICSAFTAEVIRTSAGYWCRDGFGVNARTSHA